MNVWQFIYKNMTTRIDIVVDIVKSAAAPGGGWCLTASWQDVKYINNT